MRSRRRGWWRIFGVTSTAVLAALIWVTVVVLRLEASELEGRETLRQHDAVSLALWRMDSWLSAYLAAEAARPITDYRTTDDNKPAPLARFPGGFIRLHVEFALPQPQSKSKSEPQSGRTAPRLTSPQVPPDPGTRAPGERKGSHSPISRETLDRNIALLKGISSKLEIAEVVNTVAEAERRLGLGSGIPGYVRELTSNPQQVDSQEFETQQVPDQQLDVAEARSQQRTHRADYSRRGQAMQRSVQTAQSAQTFSQKAELRLEKRAEETGGQSTIGPLVPVWGARAAGAPELYYFRRVRGSSPEHLRGEGHLQGFLVDWQLLSTKLLAEIQDLFHGARLRPLREDPELRADHGSVLASLPAVLEVEPNADVSTQVFTPVRATLMVTWLATLGALVATALSLRASIHFGDRRSLFASAVTHELRTPLTTFRMYSEMLATGMVTDPERKQLYLDTIQSESARLAALVENVLAYARVEEGRQPIRSEEVDIPSIIHGIRPNLERRCGEVAAILDIKEARDIEPPTRLFVDRDAVGQIIFNLVDNACKYGAAADQAPHITLTVATSESRVEIRIADQGPGVSEPYHKHLFEPFDRCGRESSTSPGVGLGLSLSRELARAMGGDLEFVPSATPGAHFLLTLPVAARS